MVGDASGKTIPWAPPYQRGTGWDEIQTKTATTTTSTNLMSGTTRVTGRTRGYEETKDSEDGVINWPKKKRAESM